MSSPENLVRELMRRGELWFAGPGLLGLRGETLALFDRLCAAVKQISTTGITEDAEEWRVPPALSLETLARADYFASFPQWLTVAGHLPEDEAALERIATALQPGEAARAAAAPADAALQPALCYHVWAALADSTLRGTRHATMQGTCWRHEGARIAPLERGWAFTMRETVCAGADGVVECFRRRGMQRAESFARDLGLDVSLVEASDPFFAPTSRGKQVLQRMKGLKHELTFALGREQPLALASFNHHERFFGEKFGIRCQDGRYAATGCIAFGLERWLLAFLVTHGPDAAHWPSCDVADGVGAA